MKWGQARAALLAAMTLLAGAGGARAAEPPPGPPPGPPPPPTILPEGTKPIPPRPDGRPRVALVLSGGGARGAAHIGVLRVLEELHVRPDFIVGTSMGSIVGGLYAAGYDADDLDSIVAETDWTDTFVDAVPRRDRSFRRKQDDATFLVPGKLRFKGWKPYMPKSLFGGQQLELFLRGLEIGARVPQDFNDLKIPYRAVALDLATGEGVILDHGSLASAMRASMAVPGMFAPVVIDGRTLVDGGASANLPIGIAQALGADRIIAVDITSPLYGADDIQSFFGVMSQWSSFATVGNRATDIRRLRPGDVLITPELGDISFIDFKRAAEAIEHGEAAARRQLEELRGFAVPESEWREFEEKHCLPDKSECTVDEIRINNASWVDDQIIRRRLEDPTGEPFDQESSDKAIMRLSGLDYFGLITDRYEHIDGKGVLTLDVPEKPYGRNSVQFGASFQDDFSGDANYTYALRHLLIAANRRGGEWENVGQIGQTRLLRSSFYQPFDDGMKWYGSPTFESRTETILLWEDGDPISEAVIDQNVGSLEVGRVFGDWGSLSAAAFFLRGEGDLLIGDPLPEGADENEHDGGLQLALRADTRDSVVFPRKGLLVDAWYRDSRESMGADQARQVAHLDASIAMTYRKVTFVPGISAQTLVNGPLSFLSSCTVGGFLNLSGLGTGELRAPRCVVGRLVSYLQLSHVDLGPLSTAVYGGISFESGGVFAEDSQPATWDELQTGGSIFLGASTPIGPAFVAWGATDQGEHRLYFVIGDRF